MIEWIVKSQIQAKDLQYELNHLSSNSAIYQIIQRPDGLFTVIAKKERTVK